MPYLGIFRLEFSNNYCGIRNQHCQIDLVVKSHDISKMSHLGTKNALFGNSWAGI